MLRSSAGTLLLRVSSASVSGPAAEGRFHGCTRKMFGLWAAQLHQRPGVGEPLRPQGPNWNLSSFG